MTLGYEIYFIDYDSKKKKNNKGGKEENPVVGNEELGGELRALAEVVVALLKTKTSETKGGLTTTSVLLGQIDLNLVDDFPGVTHEVAVEGAVAVNDDEAELVVLLHQLNQSLSVELVVATARRKGRKGMREGGMRK